MFRIRRIHDDILPINREAVVQVQEILRSQFKLLHEEEIAKLPDMLRNPMRHQFRTILFVAEDFRHRVLGFALILHEPDLNFCFFDYLSTGKKKMGGGIGSALYERVRQETRLLGATGLFFECLPDDPALSSDLAVRRENAARLAYFERYGTRPIAGTAYETPLKPGGDNPPYLLFDDLGRNVRLRRDRAQAIVRAILERKYGRIVSKEYIDLVVRSFVDDPVRLREPRYVNAQSPLPIDPSVPPDKKIALIVNDRHEIHHVRDRGYVESPVRVRTILREINRMGIFEKFGPRPFSETHILSVHDRGFFEYFKKVCLNLEQGESIYPYVFPIRNAARPPRELPIRAGYYCIDTFTPLNRNAFLAAKRAVDCVLTGAYKLLEGYRMAYALVRPPGHHAERNSFGGFCYFNSIAVAAQYLSKHGRVAILDVDYHHGNGQQEIFYSRRDVFTLSIHGHPRFAYPYFSGFEDERGEGVGEGFNINIPLSEQLDGARYREALSRALRQIIRFGPEILLVALGLDTAKGDPTGTWSLRARDFEENGRMIGAMRLPTLVVQEGGYDNRVLGVNARHFFSGLWAEAQRP
jgi:acetoin utilization deacetylase AcuC-like enzyme